MTALFSPSLALRSPRDGLRQKHVLPARPRAASHLAAALNAGSGMANDSVFKRFPAIGDTPAVRIKAGL
jgi:hypothetical protein